MSRHEHTGAAVTAQLAEAITSSTINFACNDLTGWPTGGSNPFYLVIDRGSPLEEKLQATTRTGNSITLATRGVDGTTAKSHALGATVEHCLTAGEVDAFDAHVNSTSGHGTASPVVGTDDVQALKNKTIDGTNQIARSAIPDLAAHIPATAGVHGVVGNVVGTAGPQTLSEKTLLAPTVTDLSNMQHNHDSPAHGGALITSGTFSPVIRASTTNPSGYSSDGLWQKVGGLVTFMAHYRFGASVGTGSYYVYLPFPCANEWNGSLDLVMTDGGANTYSGFIQLYPGASPSLPQYLLTHASPAAYVNETAPFTVAIDTEFTITGTYKFY